MPKYGAQIDYAQIPGKDMVLPSGTAFPTTPAPVKGQKFYRTDQDIEYVCTNATGPVWTATSNTVVPDASDTVKGIVELATNAETQTGTDTVRAVTPAGLASASLTLVPAATSTVAGRVELATDAEALTGTDTVRAITPANLQAKINALVAAAPGLLDTLDELAQAIGDDPNFAATMATALAGKAPLVHSHDLSTSALTGVLPIAKGGTGATTAVMALSFLGAIGVAYGAANAAMVAGTWYTIISQPSMTSAGWAEIVAVNFRNLGLGGSDIYDWRYTSGGGLEIKADVAVSAGSFYITALARPA